MTDVSAAVSAAHVAVEQVLARNGLDPKQSETRAQASFGKPLGRVGDCPILGAGVWADPSVAVSCTGTGEMFMRAVTAHDVSALMEYAGLSLQAATQRVIMDKLPRIGGRGGLIAVDAQGQVALPFNTEGMYRGYARVGSEPVCAIYGADDADGTIPPMPWPGAPTTSTEEKRHAD